jgi:hypothetical protein
MKKKVTEPRDPRDMRFLLRSIASAASFGCLLVLCGCQYTPNIRILGSFFPAWLVCLLIGIVLSAATRWLLVQMKLATHIRWTIAVYPCLALFFACTLWLILFSEGL